MELNADFTKRAVVHGAALPWQASPIPGVKRRMLDRIGDEVARATTIVRYAPNSQFSPHTHDGGEEFLVLAGVFQDEQGDYPVGTYVRNPPTSHHRPGSVGGCTILVKLWQFDPDDRTQITLNTAQQPYRANLTRLGVSTMPLFADSRETVQLERWEANTSIDLLVPHGLEIFVIQGDFTESSEVFQPYSWLRLPPDSRLLAQSGAEGCQIWLKQLESKTFH
ncbi:MAG: cupin domain-containing protein [Pegethrix bostrychoides GSE-TBD4-15B]|jgi:anti-sigma factor ChrR (cupin superfamily)|uniref:Cupin domain-containing protein n=1 Tax=Pegethrix bostrychoides GSE-TBD4-15B TaxID=2839662 RepID=A0A951U333_9CYAN|nr:cupin domain-containing protein [Pegethrix bostrychoides GSE-TBD4-15B]